MKNEDPHIYDALILPGEMPGTTNLLASEKVRQWVQTLYATQKLCCAICVAPFVFDKAGILNKHQYTCFASIRPDIAAPHYVNSAVVRDTNVIQRDRLSLFRMKLSKLC